jgi:hypothetical protein
MEDDSEYDSLIEELRSYIFELEQQIATLKDNLEEKEDKGVLNEPLLCYERT